ncbi:Flp pilus assembly protein, pilin Flp [Thermanaeromonas toyohensis ToBE]|uniref:Flp pilus assembly protein, pilin Flp n=1 Tax=Thermanaeromonas toyohensis ToBE TaxID=698762 RepID=A0A1W1VR52_9FIRM|nr:hypothetical protein [Thermanaeromonas toyohensis]SMB95710.1 Flp pilus assembly protein, pilin Flp [Thermanaeromonas toyohensis ToBE]
MKKILRDQRGSTFIENALWIILFVLAISPFLVTLATAIGTKFTEMASRINSIGTP